VSCQVGKTMPFIRPWITMAPYYCYQAPLYRYSTTIRHVYTIALHVANTELEPRGVSLRFMHAPFCIETERVRQKENNI